jgi:hypothetical protein
VHHDPVTSAPLFDEESILPGVLPRVVVHVVEFNVARGFESEECHRERIGAPGDREVQDRLVGKDAPFE